MSHVCTRFVTRSNFGFVFCRNWFLRKYHEAPRTKQQDVHPYRCIHPWKSKEEFSQYLIDTMILNADGLVVLNKPYGIATRTQPYSSIRSPGQFHVVANSVPYSIQDCLPYIKNALGHYELQLTKSLDKYTSGPVILVTDRRFEECVPKALKEGILSDIIPETYWVVTTGTAKETEGKYKLAMKLKHYGDERKKPIIIDEWSNTQYKEGLIRILRVQFKVLSVAYKDLASLIQIQTSTKKWHSVRLFAAHRLLSPVLGDNVHGLSVKTIMGKKILATEYIHSNTLKPRLDNELLKQLRFTRNMQELIPAHVHLRSVYLTNLWRNGKDILIEAPLTDPFKWTCDQLGLDYSSHMQDHSRNCKMEQEKDEENC